MQDTILVEPCDGICVRHSFEWSIGGSKFGVKDLTTAAVAGSARILSTEPQICRNLEDAEEN